MEPSIVPAHSDHIPHIVEHVRPADRAELQAAYGQSPEHVLHSSLLYSDLAWTGMLDDLPVCMFGVVPASSIGNVGRPWMVGTHYLDNHQKAFLRRNKMIVNAMRQRYSRLENYVDARNLVAIKWLQWLGFTLWLPGEPAGVYGLPFVRFEMRGIA